MCIAESSVTLLFRRYSVTLFPCYSYMCGYCDIAICELLCTVIAFFKIKLVKGVTA
jgi:hypothetical protein